MYEVNGSNTTYKVWGIIVVVFGGLTAFSVLLMTILLMATGGVMSDFVPSSFSNSYAVAVILYVLLGGLVVAVKFAAGILLIKDVIRSKGSLLFFAVLYFLSALGWLIVTFWHLAVSAGVSRYTDGMMNLGIGFWIVIYLIKIAYDVTTAIMLISKQSKAVPQGMSDYDSMPPVQGMKNYGETPTPHRVNNYNGMPASHGMNANAGYPQPTPPSPFPESPAQNPFGAETYPLPDSHQQPTVAAPQYASPMPVGAIAGLFGSFQGHQYQIEHGRSCVIGRETICDIVINHPKVSRQHCTIRKTMSGTYQVLDSSSNGTFYNNQRLPKGAAYEVPSGTILVIGNADNVVQLL